MGLADKSESKIMGLGGAQISSQSRGRARDPRRAMVDAVLGEHCNIKAFRAGRGAGRRRESRDPGSAVQPSKDRNPSIRGQTGGKIDAWGAFPAIQRPRQSAIFLAYHQRPIMQTYRTWIAHDGRGGLRLPTGQKRRHKLTFRHARAR